jgi:hypothetical protein
MDIDQLQSNLEEPMEEFDIITKERDSLKGKYKEENDYI